MLIRRLVGYILHLSLNQITLYSNSHRLGVFDEREELIGFRWG